MWVFDYRTFWNPEVDTIKVWFAGVMVGSLFSESAASELRERLGGTSIGPGDPDPVPVVEPATAPPIADAAPAPEPSAIADPPAVPEAAAASVLDPGTPSVLLDDPPAPQPGDIAIPPTVPHPENLPELVRVTCEGPLLHAVCRVMGHQPGGSIRVKVETPGDYEGDETGLLGNQYVPHVPGRPGTQSGF